MCRIGTHLFQFVDAMTNMRGNGRAMRRALAAWYMTKSPSDLAHQLTKYQERVVTSKDKNAGKSIRWAHRDVLRIAKPRVPDTDEDNRFRSAIFRWAVGKQGEGWTPPEEALEAIAALELLKQAKTKTEVAALIRRYHAPREVVPTQWHKEPEVWEALLEKMPMTAMIRNLGNMTKCGLIAPLSDAARLVRGRLEDVALLHKARIHPVGVLAALLTYKGGHGLKGDSTWTPVPAVVDALDGAFYRAFDSVEPTNKRWYLGIDVSGSMWSSQIANTPGLTAGLGATTLALVTAAVEKDWHMAAFNTQMVHFKPTPKARLDDVAAEMARIPWGGTDCSLPMRDAMQNKLKVDVFVVFTDNETYAGPIHPSQALAQYRQQSGIDTKLIVVGMTSTGFSIADPTDAGMLDVCGFSTDVPQVMANFAR